MTDAEGYQVQHWCAGWNLAGYSSDPDSVLHGTTLDEALGYLVETLTHAADSALDEYEEQEYRIAAAAVGTWNPELIEREARLHGLRGGYWVEAVQGHHYWVMPCFTVECDQVNAEYGDEEKGERVG